MALSLENANKVSQKTRKITLNPAVFFALKAFFLFWATNKGNADLQYVPFSGAEVAADDGNADKVIADAACKIHVFYAKKRATSTATWLKASDHATAASASDPNHMLEFNASGQVNFELYPDGLAQGTGWTIRQDTNDITGSTRTNAADSVDGFYILGAP